MTIIRCTTGEVWNFLMMDIIRQRNILFQCDDSDFDYQAYILNGKVVTGCGTEVGLFYFVSFVLIVPLIFLNLFIAIILEGYQ